jgi:hypothetical protein
VDWIAAILELFGAYIVGNKNKVAFILFFLAGICWMVYVATTNTTHGILIVVIPAMCMNVRNYIKWSKDDPKKTKCP